MLNNHEKIMYATLGLISSGQILRARTFVSITYMWDPNDVLAYLNAICQDHLGTTYMDIFNKMETEATSA